jgi:hypothetical protein
VIRLSGLFLLPRSVQTGYVLPEREADAERAERKGTFIIEFNLIDFVANVVVKNDASTSLAVV